MLLLKMNPQPHVIKNKRTTRERAEKFISTVDFIDVNLRGKLYPKEVPVTSIEHYAAPDRIPFADAAKQLYTPTKTGESFGPSWATHWFKVTVDVPADWIDSEVHLIWNSNCECLIWKAGKPVQGLTGGRASNDDTKEDYIITMKLSERELHHDFFIEMACNGLFGCGKDGLINPPQTDKMYTLTKAKVVIMDRAVYNLLIDIEMLIDMVKHLPDDSHRMYQALYTANEMVNLCTDGQRSGYHRAQEIASKFFSQKNGDSQHVVHAMGHCHIDTAWLWPYAETIRKCARSWTHTIRLMERYPNFKFACSQAQQYDWVKQHYPSLFEDIRKFVREGRFIPVGGTWVEMDGYVPSGEAFIRQFLYGQAFFKKEFNLRCKEFWLPDTFGYSAQIPQIMQHMGVTRFLTQKLSWNLVNKFPHHTFYWEGIDGSKVLTHFPPGDSYCLHGRGEELIKTVKNHQDKGRTNVSAYLFGQGDGGQGPSENMIVRLERVANVDGLPKVVMSTPDDLFHEIETEATHKNLCKWVGELYLELHNGSYTTQSRTKFKNRKCEFHLHDSEVLASLASVLTRGTGAAYAYPMDKLVNAWKLLLLNQFHDVLPGSSIGEVYKDSKQYYKEVSQSCQEVMTSSFESLFPSKGSSKQATIAFNTLGWERSEVVMLPRNQDQPGSPERKKMKNSDAPVTQVDSFGNTLVFVKAPSYGFAQVSEEGCQLTDYVGVKREGDHICLENLHLKATLDSVGRIVSLYVKENGQVVHKNTFMHHHHGNQYVVFDDVPLFWDAWDVMDYHLETRKPIDTVIQSAIIKDEGPLRVSVLVSLKISDKSYLKQHIILDAGSPYLRVDTEVAWHESHKFLKVEFPVRVRTTNATYEIQFGHLQRPTHFNTSWDSAKFEVCSHKWADLSEHDWGVSILNDCKYGFSTRDNVMRLSLLRSPKAPDEKADMGNQRFTYAIMPHSGSFQNAKVIQHAYNLNCRLVVRDVNITDSTPCMKSYFSVEEPGVILETVKMCEERDDAIILRFYEAFGGRTHATVTTSLAVRDAVLVNGLEEQVDECLDHHHRHDHNHSHHTHHILAKDGKLRLRFHPFQIVSVMLII
ncbi:alpha-mannosidase 2C1-like isoform X2 [Lineus longissimus]|uniref:alpha-mannosidase 2C1-like isoform X2 n=1 Tax=Lineus longissimus TaxID=88925 RepID=UPI00315D656C